jgi:cytochrome c peroxidase
MMMHASGTRRASSIIVMLGVFGLLTLVFPQIAVADSTGGLKPLRSVPVPLPANLGDFVIDRAAAIRLGKAFFWDQQAGGDGFQACATCHFQSGADVRATDTLNPGANGVFGTAPAGATITASNFPISNGDVVGSGGIVKSNFVGLGGGPADNCVVVPDATFNVGGANVRQVTGRNAPFAVNAIFNYRSFWDGRANNVFNGVNPSGASDNAAVVYDSVGGVLNWTRVAIPDASLASQAVGPPGSGVEMACAGRTFPLIGRKLLGLTPLGLQVVHPTDSVLGALSRSPAGGLNTTYAAMIPAAFDARWWNDPSGALVNGFNIMEQNFSLYWGLAIMLYESTLVSDDTRVDRFLAGNAAALNAQEQLGLKIYTGKGRCNKCHGGAELTEASSSQTGGDPTTGFTNTGVRPVAEDGGDILQPGQAKFKTPGLRNIELTGPYFHNGDKATLRQVVDFYDRGGDFPNQFTDSDVRNLSLTSTEKNALVAFMLALTDDRVRYERAPFDHPSLDLPNFGILPAVGATGRTVPVKPFLNVNHFQP